MAASKDNGDSRPAGMAIDSDIDFAGYDPYIVALTGGASAGLHSEAAVGPDQAAESRKVQLMTWLREHGN